MAQATSPIYNDLNGHALVWWGGSVAANRPAGAFDLSAGFSAAYVYSGAIYVPNADEIGIMVLGTVGGVPPAGVNILMNVQWAVDPVVGWANDTSVVASPSGSANTYAVYQNRWTLLYANNVFYLPPGAPFMRIGLAWDAAAIVGSYNYIDTLIVTQQRTVPTQP